MPIKDLFHGKLVRLAAPLPEDYAIFAEWSNDPEYMRHLDTDFARPSNTQTQTDAEVQHSGPNSVVFHIRTLQDNRLIGFVALHSIEWNNQAAMLAIGIGLSDYRGRGYGSESLELILNFAFNELNLYRVGLHVISNNGSAIRTYEAAGFVQEGVQRSSVFRDQQRIDCIHMGILREEYFNKQKG